MEDPNSNTPPAAPAAVVVEPKQQQPAPEQAPTTDERDKKIEELELKLAEANREADTQRMKAAIASANKRVEPMHTGADDARRAQAIKVAGGVAKWHSLPSVDRAKILNDGVCPEITDEKLAQVFGPKSSAVEANRLSRENPARYRALRILAKERGLL